MGYVIGVDVSTTATKAILVGEGGAFLAEGSSEYGFETPNPNWSEQDPLLWWDATVAAIRSALDQSEVSGHDVEAVGLTGQMHGAVLLDAGAEVLRPAILWNDQRTSAECDEIRSLLGDQLIPITGNDALTGFTAPKLVWVKRHEPEIWKQVSHVLLPKDYVRNRLTGGFATDAADGAGTQLFDLASRTWSGVVLDALEIDERWMPQVFEGPEVTGMLTRQAAESTGLREGTPVIAGGGDQAANAIGLGVVEPGLMALSVGTSGVVFAPTSIPLIDPLGRVHSFCHAVPDRWHLMGVMLSAAGSLRWLRDALAPSLDFGDLMTVSEDVEAARDGLFFLPYLTGERTPHADPDARGAFVGLTIRHDLRHMTRAVLEGVAFGLKDCLDLMVTAGTPRPDEIRASGGGTRSPLWVQILADVLGTRVALVDTTEAAAFGAALLAEVGVGAFGDIAEAVEASVSVRPSAEPGSERAQWDSLHAEFASLYPALAPTFRRAGTGTS